MSPNLVARVLLYPFSLIYGLIVATRNLLYDAEVIKSNKFSVPTISVGNLSIGGAGKTPHVEYLINLLNPYINVATLSRGYNRITKGFRFVQKQDTAKIAGDEPLMYARKHNGIVVAIGESRSFAIPRVVGQHPETQVILLDDAFQHRSVQPFINVLLTPYEHPFTRDFMLPMGRLREWKSSYERADVIIVTKCPSNIDEKQRTALIKEINPQEHQQVFFSKYVYENPYSFYYPRSRVRLDKEHDVVLLSAIANTNYLVSYVSEQVGSYTKMEYEDHHNYTDRDIEYIIKVFRERSANKKFILTTEKDAMRLDVHRQRLYDEKIPIYVLPLHVEILFDQKEEFDTMIKSKLLEFEV